MKEYLVRHKDTWHIGQPGAILYRPNQWVRQIEIAGQYIEPDEERIRLAWFERGGAFICFEGEADDVQELPR